MFNRVAPCHAPSRVAIWTTKMCWTSWINWASPYALPAPN